MTDRRRRRRPAVRDGARRTTILSADALDVRRRAARALRARAARSCWPRAASAPRSCRRRHARLPRGDARDPRGRLAGRRAAGRLRRTAASRSPARPTASSSSTRSTRAPRASWPTSRTPTRPTWANQVGGHVNLIDAIEGTITYDSLRRQALRARRRARDAARAPARLAPAREAPARRRRAGRRRALDFGLYSFHNAPAAARRAAAAPYFYLPEDGAPPRGAAVERRLRRSPRRRSASRSGTIRATVLIETLPGGVPDGRDPLRAARALLRPQRRPLGLHLLDDQVLPRPAGLRAPRPQRREDDRAVHAGLHGAAGQDLPRAAARSRWAAWRR